MLRTRAPCAGSLYCYRKLRTRLACVKHAASVRSEPGSNSRLKLVALKIKTPSRIPNVRDRDGPDFQGELFVARFTQLTERVLARIIRLSKSGPPVRQVGFQAISNHTGIPLQCQAPPAIFHNLRCAGYLSTRRLLVTEKAPGTPLAWMLAMFRSMAVATTPSSVTWPFLTMMWMGGTAWIA